jgi:nucleoside-diphosphate-sugar epimerase
MTTLVTGASGMLGRAVASALAEDGHRVRVFQRGSAGIPAADIDEVRGSVTDHAAVALAVAGCDAVVHLAAKVSLTGPADEFEAVNVEGTRALLDAASSAGVARFVCVSSPSVAHSGSSIVGDDALPADPDSARGHYARTKATAERLALAADAPGFSVVAVRPHLVWGPGDTQLVARIVDRASRGRLPLIGHGVALVDSTYIDNAASAIVAATNRADALHGNAYVVTNGEPRPIAELIGGMCAAAGVARPTWSVPAGLARAAGVAVETLWRGDDEPPMTAFLAEQLSTAHWFDQRRTRRDLEWMPAVSLDEGLDLLAASFRL